MDTTFAHLNTELARIDLLIHRRVGAMERAAAAIAAADAAGRGAETPGSPMHMSAEEAMRILQQPFGTVAQTLDDPEDEANYAVALARLEAQISAIVGAVDETGEESRLVRLATICELTRFDLDCLLIAMAPAIDLRYERLFGFLHDDLTRRRATANLMLDLLAQAGPERLLYFERFGENAPLMRHRLLEPVAEPGIIQPVALNQGLAVNGTIVAWLLGDYHPDAALADYVEYQAEPMGAEALQALGMLMGRGGEQASDAEEDESTRMPLTLALTAEQVGEIAHAAENDAFLVLVGKDRSTQVAAQRAYAAMLGTPLLTLDMRAVVRPGPETGEDRHLELRRDLRDLLALFLRDAGLIHATAAITGWDAVLQDGSPPATLMSLLVNYVGPVAIASEGHWRSHAVTRARRFTWLDLPLPDYAQRREMLGSLANRIPAMLSEPPDEEIDVVGLAGRYRLTAEQMEDMLATALDRAGQNERGLRNADLFAAARDHSSPRLASLARKLSLRYDWDDLILPDDQVERLRELVGMVRGRAQVLDEWGLLKKLAPSYGVTALFAGSPGTGKTMAAEVIAKALDLDVFKIDLSGMVSKYIGETEKNLEKVFNEAENTSAILFFDEADAIFGKRSEVKDAHDRYANIETSYLLQRMEAYDGVTILSTNLRANLDEAFTRRMNSIVDFPFPDEEQRLRIWQTLYPKQVPSADDVDLTLLARRFKIAGGSIRNILVAAAYFASTDGGVLAMRHLMHGTRRELQKLGRLTEDSDFLRA